LHGAGGNEANWTRAGRGGSADIILDNLYADKKAVPMIVVMPNGTVTPAGQGPGAGKAGDGKAGGAGGQRRGRGAGFGNMITGFENELLKDVIPYVEAHFPVLADREHR